MSALVWGMEWKLARANKRRLTYQAVAALAVVVVASTGAVAESVASVACVTLFTAMGMLSTSMGLYRSREVGLTQRVLRAGVSPSAYLVQRTAAGAGLVFLSLLPSVIVVLVAVRAPAAQIVNSLVALAAALWVSGGIGALLAAWGRSRTEVLVASAVVLLVLLHVSGVFREPPPGLGALLEAASPFHALHRALSAGPSGGPQGLVAAAAWAIALLAGVLVGAPRLRPLRERRG